MAILTRWAGSAAAYATLTSALGALVFGPASPLVAQAPAVADSARIELHASFFRGVRFTKGGLHDAPVYRWDGLRFANDFEEALGECPSAFEEASRARPWNLLALVGALGFVFESGKLLLEAVHDASEVQGGSVPAGRNGNTDLAIALVSAVAVIAGASQARRHLRRGVALFNGHAGSRVGRASASLGLRGAPARRPQVRVRVELRPRVAH